MRTHRIGFILEQTLGHVTHTRNLRANLSNGPAEIVWGEVTPKPHALLDRLPLARNWTVRAGLQARRLVSAMAHDGPLDALFFHTQVPAILATSWIRRVPSVVSLDATPWQIDSLGGAYRHGVDPAPAERAKWMLNRACFRAARHLVTWSHWTRDALVSDYEVAAEKITVVPPGVNPGDWTPSAPRHPPEGPVRILFVGADLERKGGRLLVELLPRLRALGAEVHLVTRATLPAQPGLVVHNGVTPNSPRLRELYQQSDVFCLPTLGDCLPMVLAEAGASELPLVSTGVGAIPEVARDGETGFVVPPGDRDALGDALEKLVVDPSLRLRLGQAARALVQREHDARRNAHRLLEIIEAVASAPASARDGAPLTEPVP